MDIPVDFLSKIPTAQIRKMLAVIRHDKDGLGCAGPWLQDEFGDELARRDHNDSGEGVPIEPTRASFDYITQWEPVMIADALERLPRLVEFMEPYAEAHRFLSKFEGRLCLYAAVTLRELDIELEKLRRNVEREERSD